MLILFFRMTDVPKIENGSSSLFDSKLSETTVKNIINDIVLMLSRFPDKYCAVILKNASRVELETLAESLEEKIAGIKGNEVFRLSSADITYKIWKIEGHSPIRTLADNHTCESLFVTV